MEKAIEEAKKGAQKEGVPVGSVLVLNENIIGSGHNRRIQDGDPTAHAEIVCLRKAGRIRNYANTILYSTLMPCFLCAGAVVQFGIKKVVVGESRTFTGARDFLESHKVEVVDLDLKICQQLMEEFIKKYPDVWFEDIGK